MTEESRRTKVSCLGLFISSCFHLPSCNPPPTYLWEVIETKYPSGGNGQVRTPSAHQSSQRRPTPTAVVGYGLVLTRQIGEGALYGLGDGKAGVVDDVAQVGVGQQVFPFVYFVDGKQHGLGPTEGTEVKPEG